MFHLLDRIHYKQHF